MRKFTQAQVQEMPYRKAVISQRLESEPFLLLSDSANLSVTLIFCLILFFNAQDDKGYQFISDFTIGSLAYHYKMEKS